MRTHRLQNAWDLGISIVPLSSCVAVPPWASRANFSVYHTVHAAADIIDGYTCLLLELSPRAFAHPGLRPLLLNPSAPQIWDPALIVVCTVRVACGMQSPSPTAPPNLCSRVYLPQCKIMFVTTINVKTRTVVYGEEIIYGTPAAPNYAEALWSTNNEVLQSDRFSIRDLITRTVITTAEKDRSSRGKLEVCHGHVSRVPPAAGRQPRHVLHVGFGFLESAAMVNKMQPAAGRELRPLPHRHPRSSMLGAAAGRPRCPAAAAPPAQKVKTFTQTNIHLGSIHVVIESQHAMRNAQMLIACICVNECSILAACTN